MTRDSVSLVRQRRAYRGAVVIVVTLALIIIPATWAVLDRLAGPDDAAPTMPATMPAAAAVTMPATMPPAAGDRPAAPRAAPAPAPTSAGAPEPDPAAPALPVTERTINEQPPVIERLTGETLPVNDWQALPPCEREDSRDCYWDAAARGNGRGLSFYDVGGEVFYVTEDPSHQ